MPLHFAKKKGYWLILPKCFFFFEMMQLKIWTFMKFCHLNGTFLRGVPFFFLSFFILVGGQEKHEGQGSCTSHTDQHCPNCIPSKINLELKLCLYIYQNNPNCVCFYLIKKVAALPILINTAPTVFLAKYAKVEIVSLH